MWILKHNNDTVMSREKWEPAHFANVTGTSFPDAVPDGWSWEQGFWTLTQAPDPPPPDVTPAAKIHAQIAELEGLQTPRRIRDALLTQSGAAWLADVEAQIAALRAQL